MTKSSHCGNLVRLKDADSLGQEHKSTILLNLRCTILQLLGKQPHQSSQVKGDLEMLRNDGLGPDDPQTALKQRLLDLNKKNRRLQEPAVAVDVFDPGISWHVKNIWRSLVKNVEIVSVYPLEYPKNLGR